MVIPSMVTEFYRERIEGEVAYMRHLALDIGETNRLREVYGGEDWEFEELTRHIIFLENQTSQTLMEDIERARKTIREHEKRRALESAEGV